MPQRCLLMAVWTCSMMANRDLHLGPVWADRLGVKGHPHQLSYNLGRHCLDRGSLIGRHIEGDEAGHGWKYSLGLNSVFSSRFMLPIAPLRICQEQAAALSDTKMWRSADT